MLSSRPTVLVRLEDLIAARHILPPRMNLLVASIASALFLAWTLPERTTHQSTNSLLDRLGPVMSEAACECRNTTAPATSIGFPMHFGMRTVYSGFRARTLDFGVDVWNELDRSAQFPRRCIRAAARSVVCQLFAVAVRNASRSCGRSPEQIVSRT